MFKELQILSYSSVNSSHHKVFFGPGLAHHQASWLCTRCLGILQTEREPGSWQCCSLCQSLSYLWRFGQAQQKISFPIWSLFYVARYYFVSISHVKLCHPCGLAPLLALRTDWPNFFAEDMTTFSWPVSETLSLKENPMGNETFNTGRIFPFCGTLKIL